MQLTEKRFLRYDTAPSTDLLGWSRWDISRTDYESPTSVVVGAIEVTFEVPDDFDPRPAQVKALEAKERELRAQFAAAVTEIQRQISQLQAIEHSEAA